MAPRPVAVRAIRWLAALAAWAYPSAFRHAHGHTFGDAAEHLWRRERSSAPAWRATLTTARILIGDTITGSPAIWMTALEDGHTRSMAARAGRALRFIGGSGHDSVLALRAARRRPGFALLVVLTLGLGIGASTTAFDALDRTILRPLPFPDSDRLIYLSLRDPQRGSWATPVLETLNVWRDRSTTLEQIEIHAQTSMVLHGPAGAERLDGLAVSGGLLEMLRTVPVAGRLLRPQDADADAAPAVLIGERTWRARFGSDAGIVGRVLMLGAVPRPTTVVGILPAGAKIDTTLTPEFVTTLRRGREYPRGAAASILARMKPGVTPDAVEAELRTMTAALQDSTDVRVPDAVTPADLYLGEAFTRGVWLVFAGAMGLLAVSVVNAGHLLLGRAIARGHELGVRLVLGGSPLRLARLFLAEAVVYAVAGVVLGICIMTVLERVIHRYEARLFMTMDGAGLDGRAFWFVLIVAGGAMLSCAAVPLLRARKQDLRNMIDAGETVRSTSRTGRTMSVLVVTQAAIAVVLLCGAAVMLRSFRNLATVDTGVAIHELVEIAAAAPPVRYSTREARAAYLQQVEHALEAIPSVTGVTTSVVPLLSSSPQNGVPYLDGEPKPADADAGSTGLANVPLDFFEVTGIRVISGRLFTSDDGPDVAVVNQAFAASREHDVVGRLVFTPDGSTPFRIVGIVSNVKSFGIADTRTRYQVYLPQRRLNPDVFTRFFVRTSGEPATIVAEARRRIAEIDRSVPMFSPQTGTQVIHRQTAQHRFAAVLLSGLAALGLGLALSGVYGSVALSVSRRRREIGIRMALGATRRSVVQAILATGVRLVAIGSLAGVAGAWLALPAIDVLLFNVASRDPWSTMASLALVAAAAATASWFPARRASRVDPAVTLRHG